MMSVSTHSPEVDSSHDDANVWLNSFTEEDRQEQVAEDSLAWHRVAGLLLAVVGIGLVIAVIAVTVSA